MSKFSNFKIKWPKSVKKLHNGGRLGPLRQDLPPPKKKWIRPYVVLLSRTASPSLAVIAVTVKIQIGRMTMIDQGDGKEVVWGLFWEQWTTNSDSAPQETPLNICRLAIGHCEVNRGQWPQVTLIDLKTHMMQGHGSQLVMYWHQSHQLYPFKSFAPRQVAFTHDFAEILSKVEYRWNNKRNTSYDVITSWPDLTWPNFFTKSYAKDAP